MSAQIAAKTTGVFAQKNLLLNYKEGHMSLEVVEPGLRCGAHIHDWEIVT